MPDGPDGVNNELGWKGEPGCDSGFASRARADISARFFEARSHRFKYRPADAAAPEQAFIGGVYDGIYCERRDVGDDARDRLHVVERVGDSCGAGTVLGVLVPLPAGYCWHRRAWPMILHDRAATMKKDDRKKQKKRLKEQKKATERRKHNDVVRRAHKAVSRYPEVIYVEDEGDPDFISIVRKAQLTIDLDDPVLCPKPFRDIYESIARRGYETTFLGFGEDGEQGQQHAREIALSEMAFRLHYGQVIYERIPEEVRRAHLPYNDAIVDFQDHQIVIGFSSMLKTKGTGGTIYYSRKEPRITIAGQEYRVGFSRHAIDQAVVRLNPNYLRFEASYDVHSFFAKSVVHEPAVLDSRNHPEQDAFSMYDECNNPLFISYDTYVNRVYGLEGHEPDPTKGIFCFRLGYFPVVIDNGFAKATSFMRPGYTGTPERRLLLEANSLPRNVKDFLVTEARENTGREVLLDERLDVIKWFHQNGVPQVVQFPTAIYDHTPTSPRKMVRRVSIKDRVKGFVAGRKSGPTPSK